MIETVWTTPVAPTDLERIVFKQLGGRRCELSFRTEDSAGREAKVGTLFDGVEAYRCTYMTSLTSEMIRLAYGKLVRLGETPWLTEVSEISAKRYRTSRQPPRKLQHLMICFDDDPCYEVICVSFEPFGCDLGIPEDSGDA